MKKQTMGALLIVLLGGLGIAAYLFLSPLLFERSQLNTSAARRASSTIRIGGDGYLGYWFLTSPEMRKMAARRGFAIDFHDDGGAYIDRLQKFADGAYDAIVLPVNSYRQHGAPHGYPGVIVEAIAESKGADGIVGFADKFPSGAMKELNNAGLQIVYTAASPSSFLLDLIMVDFDLYKLSSTDQWRREVQGSEDAYDLAKKREGDAFVMWEPELSRALDEIPGLKYIWGSDKFEGYIIDVFVFRRDFLRKHQDEIVKFFDLYFAVMNNYRSDRARMLADIQSSTGLKEQVAQRVLEKIDWFDLYDNASLQFGLPTQVGAAETEGLANCILANTDVLKRTGKLANDPLKGDPYRILNPSIIQALIARNPVRPGASQGVARRDFPHLEAREWDTLAEVGALRVEPIDFEREQSQLHATAKAQVDKFATLLVNNYPQYRVAVRGHTGRGDEAANLILSSARADAVVQRLVEVHGLDRDRFDARGLGSNQPPEKRPNENPRVYQSRWPRVEFVLLTDHPA